MDLRAALSRTAMTFAFVALGACTSPNPETAPEAVPPWVSDRVQQLSQLGLDPVANLETKGNYHWRWRASRPFDVSGYHCPAETAVDISRSILAVVPPQDAPCTSSRRAAAAMLRLNPDGSVEPIPDEQ